MIPGQERIVCPVCKQNNMPEMRNCFKCGASLAAKKPIITGAQSKPIKEPLPSAPSRPFTSPKTKQPAQPIPPPPTPQNPQPTNRICPQCQQSNLPNVELCWKCGFNLRTGRISFLQAMGGWSSCYQVGCGCSLMIIGIIVLLWLYGGAMK